MEVSDEDRDETKTKAQHWERHSWMGGACWSRSASQMVFAQGLTTGMSKMPSPSCMPAAGCRHQLAVDSLAIALLVLSGLVLPDQPACACRTPLGRCPNTLDGRGASAACSSERHASQGYRQADLRHTPRGLAQRSTVTGQHKRQDRATS